MQFVFSKFAGDGCLNINGDIYKYLIKVRRHKIGDSIFFRNLNDHNLYEYICEHISKKDIDLKLKSNMEKIVEPSKSLHIIWSVIDPKIIEKQLPYLNEIGVKKISFVYTDYSQKNFKLNFEKMNKILINSSQQCGRSSIINLDIIEDFYHINKLYPNTYMFNFSNNYINNYKDEIETIVIGCEGGFSSIEIESFEKSKVVGVNSSLILRSETAITAVASKLLL